MENNQEIMACCFALAQAGEDIENQSSSKLCRNIQYFQEIMCQSKNTELITRISDNACNSIYMILSFSLDTESCEISDMSLANSSVKLLHYILSCISKLDRRGSTLKNIPLSDTVIDKLLLQLTLMIDFLRISEKKNNFDEFICLLFDSYFLLLIILGNRGPKIRRRCLSGPFLAQIVQNCLLFSKHDSKQVSLSALFCLDKIVSIVQDPITWRTYLPGTFAGLYISCRMGYKKYEIFIYIIENFI